VRTEDAIPILKAACKIPFQELFKGHPADLTTNKGHAGQLLERYIGLKLGNHLIDFDDGELKTNKTAPNGDPIETIAVTQIAGVIDDMLADPHCDFERSPLCKKLDNLVVVPVVKNGPCSDWYLLDVYQIDLQQNPRLKRQFPPNDIPPP
jgi:DNA mismatch repair protein MutH